MIHDLIHRCFCQDEPFELLAALREIVGPSVTAWERTARREDVERVWLKVVWRVEGEVR